MNKIEVLRSIYDLMWREGKTEEAISRLPPEIAWVTPNAVGTTYREGHEEVTRFFLNWLEVFEPVDVSYEFVDRGERVVALSYFRGIAKASGVETDIRFGQVWTFEEGLPIRCEFYETFEQALEEAGPAS